MEENFFFSFIYIYIYIYIHDRLYIQELIFGEGDFVA